MKTLKTNQLQTIKLNNKTYIPFQLHQLPKNYNTEKIPLVETFSLKGYCYINKDYLKESDYKFITFNRDLGYKTSK
tara:strand:- start:540 stop:767 length:228 start_codon:yes stop_codon:yes gene_type:complete